MPAGREDRRERRVEPNRRVGVQQAHAVRADHPHAVAAHLVGQGVLQRAPVAAGFGKPCGDDHDRSDAGGGAVVHDAEHRRRGNGDDRQVDAGQFPGRRVHLRASHFSGMRVHGVHGAREAGCRDRVKHPPADVRRIARGADHGDGARREQRTNRRGRGKAVPLFLGRDAGRRRLERQLDVDATLGRFGSNLEAGVAKHFEHPRVVLERRGLEAAEAVAGRRHGQPLEQRGSQAFALKFVSHRERRLGGVIRDRDVGRCRDDPEARSRRAAARSTTNVRARDGLVDR